MKKLHKVSVRRAFACMLAMFVLLTVWAFAETAVVEEAAGAPAEVEAVVNEGAVSEDGKKLNADGDPDVDFFEGIADVFKNTGFAQSLSTTEIVTDDNGVPVYLKDDNGNEIIDENGYKTPETRTYFEWRNYVMIIIACVLLYLAIVKEFEPLLLLPIAFGMLLANLPAAGLMAHAGPSYTFYGTTNEGFQQALAAAEGYRRELTDVVMRFNPNHGCMEWALQTANGGLMYYLYEGVKLGIYPPLIFLGIGAMTDFSPLIANPISLLLGAAAQLGIFITFMGAKLLGFTAKEAGAIGIIGGADGPTAIFVTTKLAPHLLGAIAVAAYSYMALVPVIQPPIMRALTTPEERLIHMPQLRQVSKTEKIIFPIAVTIIVSLLLPDAASLVGMLMLGNLMSVCGVVDRINKTAQNELINIVTIFLGITVGATTEGSNFLTFQTIKIVVLGVIAFGFGTAGGVLLGKLLCKITHGKINPLIGSAGVSAVPMAARVSQKVGQEYDPSNFLLMNAMGPNVAGVIGSAVAAGVFIALFA